MGKKFNFVVSAWVLAGIILLFIGCALRLGERHTPPLVLVERSQWPHETSDLKPDENMVFGRLANGLGYILKENRTPRERVSMHLHVQVGSLAESDGEEGMAHFLEHMLFNGSTHFSPGELVKYFQRIGMQFGPDANARTGFAQTIYDIHLPRGDEAAISEGLLVLSDFAQGALLLPEEIDKEIQVVLAEKRSRDSARYRALKAAFAFEMPGALPPMRFPIGTVEAIQSFDSQSVRRFYDAWYRPERMVLVMVGEFDLTTARRLIEERFGGMQPRAEALPLPDFGRFRHMGVQPFYHFDKELGATTVSIGTVTQQITPNDSVSYRRAELLEAIVNRMVQRRLDALVQQPDSVVTGARIGSGHYLQQLRFAELSADSRPEHWDQALAVIERTLRTTLELGFSPAELERAKRAHLADLRRAADEENTRDSRQLAQGILGSLGRGEVIQSASQRLELLGPMVDRIDLGQVNDVFADIWSAPHRLVKLSGNADLAVDAKKPEERILEAFSTSQAVAVHPHPEDDDGVFPYLSITEASNPILRQEPPDDLGITQIWLANGIRVTLKPTRFRENEVLAALSFGRGRSSEPADRPGLAQLTEAVVNESGFGTMDRIALENVLAGRLAEISLEVREDMFVVRGEAVRQELPLLFQLYHAFINDPGYRADAFQVVMGRLEQHHRALQHSAEGLLQLRGQAFLAGGDTRFGRPEWDRLRTVTLEDIRQWFGPPLAEAPLELAVVGDFAVDEAVDLAARYLGSLPSRSATIDGPRRPEPTFPAGRTLHLTAPTDLERGLVLVAFPTADFWNIQRTRRLNLLADLFSERLRVHVREKLGAAYSPFAYHRAHRAYQDYGLLGAYLLVDPRLVTDMATEVARLAEELKTQGIDADELRRALDPTLNQVKDLRQRNTYWLNSVLIGAGRHPEQLDWARAMEADFAAITVTEMNALAARYLDPANAATIVIVPRP